MQSRVLLHTSKLSPYGSITRSKTGKAMRSMKYIGTHFVAAISIFATTSSAYAQPAILTVGPAGLPQISPVYEVAEGRILIKPRLKYELAISLHVLKFAEDDHAIFIPWAQRMRKNLSASTLKEASVLIGNAHEWQLGSLVQDYDGPDTVENLAAFVRADKSGHIQEWASHRGRLMETLGTTPKEFPEWYAGFLQRYYQGGFGREWEAEHKNFVYNGAKSLAEDFTSLHESPAKFMERMTGRLFPEKARLVFYPSSFSRPQHAYAFTEAGDKVVVYKVGSSSETLCDAYHELMHPLIRGWWEAQRMHGAIAELAQIPLFRRQWEQDGKGSYSYPEGWIDELIVHSVAAYLGVRAGILNERSARQNSYNGYEDALYDAIFDRFEKFKTIDDFIHYALTHIRMSGEGERQRFAYFPTDTAR